MATLSQNGRLEVRLSKDKKALIDQAADLLGQSVSSFTVSTLVERARSVVDRHTVIKMSDSDRDRFLSLLDHPPAPNAALKRAAKRHGESVGT